MKNTPFLLTVHISCRHEAVVARTPAKVVFGASFGSQNVPTMVWTRPVICACLRHHPTTTSFASGQTYSLRTDPYTGILMYCGCRCCDTHRYALCCSVTWRQGFHFELHCTWHAAGATCYCFESHAAGKKKICQPQNELALPREPLPPHPPAPRPCSRSQGPGRCLKSPDPLGKYLGGRGSGMDRDTEDRVRGFCRGSGIGGSGAGESPDSDWFGNGGSGMVRERWIGGNGSGHWIHLPARQAAPKAGCLTGRVMPEGSGRTWRCRHASSAATRRGGRLLDALPAAHRQLAHVEVRRHRRGDGQVADRAERDLQVVRRGGQRHAAGGVDRKQPRDLGTWAAPPDPLGSPGSPGACFRGHRQVVVYGAPVT
eukprot:gene6109-biopygen16358